MTYVQMQFQLAIARASAWQARITSGAYKQSAAQVANGTNPDGTFTWRDQTDDEKLADAVATMDRHLKFAQDCLDAFGQSMERP